MGEPTGGAAPADALATGRCPGCGEPAGAADRFCEQCGQPLDHAEPAPQSPAPPPAGAAPPDRPQIPGEGARTAGAPSAGGLSAGGLSAGVPPNGMPGAGANGAGAGAVAGPAAPARCRCGNGQADADGYCDSCGTRVTTGGRRDESQVRSAAVASDPGLVHTRNEDAGVVAETAGLIFAVVCDGVSTAPRPDEAARAAVSSAAEVLSARLGQPSVAADPSRRADPDSPATSDSAADALVESALRDAVAAAVVAVNALADPAPSGPDVPACTFVAAVLRPAGSLHVAHVGDSRAYWLPDDGPPSQLTVDDSWATDAIRAGVEPAVAWADDRAHTLTGWLGADAGPVEPQLRSIRLAGPGLVVVCSDGLWNYLIDLAGFADRVRGAYQQAGADLLGCARILVDFARSCGGHDNCTVAVLRHHPGAGADQTAQPDHAATEEGRRP